MFTLVLPVIAVMAPRARSGEEPPEPVADQSELDCEDEDVVCPTFEWMETNTVPAVEERQVERDRQALARLASLYPGLPGVHEQGVKVIAVRDSPKPPPERLSFTVDAINASDRVWLVVAGADKAEAVALARSGAAPEAAPAGTAPGRVETLMLLDEAAAGSSAS